MKLRDKLEQKGQDADAMESFKSEQVDQVYLLLVQLMIERKRFHPNVLNWMKEQTNELQLETGFRALEVLIQSLDQPIFSQVFEILPPLTKRIGQPSVNVQAGEQVRGDVWVQQLVQYLVNTKPHEQNMLQLVQNIKHILKQDQVPQLLTTMLSMFQKIPDDDKPIMVSELLILGRQANVKNMLSLVSRELFKWSKQSSPLLSLGLLQINYSLKQDQQLCQDFYKTLKQNTELLFDHMNLELVLLVMNQKGNEPLLDLLANTILNQYKLEARSKSLEWIQTNTQVERIERRLLSIFESTGQLGWDQIIISSLTLILRLQEQVHLIPDKQMSDRLSDLVSNVLQLLFQKMPMLQQTILDHLMTGSKKYVHQIKKLCEKCPNEVIKHMNLVSEMIESLLQTADEHLLEALVLLCDNQQVYDKMMMVLRKGSIQREQLCRELSIKGYALLLKTNKHTDELLGGLRRAFAQQLSCRVLAYQKLLEFALLNEGIRVHVLGLFHRQLLTYKQERFPLSIEKCYENGKIQEALAMLVHCTSYLAHLTKSKPILDFLTRVAEQASKVELADFDMVQADEPLKQDRLYLAVSLLHSLFCHALLLQDGQTLANCLQKKIQAFMDSRKEKAKGFQKPQIPEAITTLTGQVLLAKAMNEGISTESRMLFLTLLSAAAKKQANLPLCQQLFASLVGKDQLKQMEKKQSLLLTEAFEQSLLQLEHPFQVFQMESKTVCKLLLQCANQLSAEQPKQGIKFLKILDHLLSKEKIHLTEPLYSILQNNESHDPHFCRETVLMWARSLNKHPKALLKLSESIFVIYGQRIQNDQDLGENRLKLVNNETVAHAVTAFLSFIDQQLESMDWVTQNWKMFDNLDLVSERMGLFVSLVEMLCQTSLPSDTNDMIVKTLTRLYKIMANIAKLNMDGPVSNAFLQLINFVSSLTRLLYQILPDLETPNKEKKKSRQTGSSKIPNLVFQIEQYERYLIKLGKKNQIAIMQYVRRSTARDFRINLRDIPDENDDPKKRLKETE